MQAFLNVMMQILAISGIQILLEGILKQWEKTEMVKILNIACYLGALYVVWQFFENYILKNFQSLFRVMY
ncbi:MAG: hypothetical protein GX238_01200 [Epulopiscium sp.]|nr:hypothetical protein [Candidatus Epulonipiscium sp.]